jgi:N-acetylglucosaminyldiphosphoundecaprenol N-acetyl-beta-D-mannosaminyltransferase
MKPSVRSVGETISPWQVPGTTLPVLHVAMPALRQRQAVIGMPIDVIDWDATIGRIQRWVDARESRMVSLCNVHTVVTARQDSRLAAVLRHSDLNTADGAPVAWLMRLFGRRGQQRINGPDLMWRYCAAAAQRNESIFLYGGRPDTLERLQQRLAESFPGLHIAGAYSPPYRELTEEEDDAVVRMIEESGAGTVWVSLGCPKQDFWMAAHRGRISATMIGVGAAFAYHAGTLRRAPLWMQRGGLEWLHRLASEPGRLWRRYLTTNTYFVFAATAQWLQFHMALRAERSRR